ncbi:MAG: hypothetical protein DLM66_13935 [Candidatus Dormiibacter spiritus]|nr:MAG: hypothetical protein DLM66_13935 [Candidatus Dormibacteraeota bacterium]
MRAACKFLQGQRAQAIADIDRLYAVNPEYPNVTEEKRGMLAGTFKLEPPQHFPDWYPNDVTASSVAEAAAQVSPDASGGGTALHRCPSHTQAGTSMSSKSLRT